MSTGQMIVGVATIVFTVIAAVATATWVLSEKINESRVEFHKEIGEVREEMGEIRVEIREENAKTRDETRKEIGELRVEFHKNMGELRGYIGNIDTKVNEFKGFHEREHDIFYGAADKDDKENSTSAN